jgi:hypothetical protein
MDWMHIVNSSRRASVYAHTTTETATSFLIGVMTWLVVTKITLLEVTVEIHTLRKSNLL